MKLPALGKPPGPPKPGKSAYQLGGVAAPKKLAGRPRLRTRKMHATEASAFPTAAAAFPTAPGADPNAGAPGPDAAAAMSAPPSGAGPGTEGY